MTQEEFNEYLESVNIEPRHHNPNIDFVNKLKRALYDKRR